MRLAQQYRPATFDSAIGQDAAVAVLKAIITSGRYESAYLFSGPSGTGKTTLGRIFAMAMLCDSPQNGNPCTQCDSCKAFLSEKHFGYTELDAASFGGKDDMVRLRDDAAVLSAHKKKIILLDECHDISRAGQDALLKQVEQCPEHLVYMFCTTDPDKMNETLLNRCMRFQISKVTSGMIAQRLKYICESQHIQYQDEALLEVAERGNGHVRNAINLLEEVACLGAVTTESIGLIVRDCESEVLNVLLNIGSDLGKSVEACRKAMAITSPTNFYNTLISMVSDSCQLLYGYDVFSQRRMQMIASVKEKHGYSLLEFLDYLVSRDKFVDGVGIQSDIIVLHYKFGANSFVPRQTTPITNVLPQNSVQTQTVQFKEEDRPKSAPSLTINDMLKLDPEDRASYMREQKARLMPESKQETEKVSSTWPLPKEDRVGESSETEELSPQEFSRLLVGGRGGAIF